jgi:hypothetical protein
MKILRSITEAPMKMRALSLLVPLLFLCQNASSQESERIRYIRDEYGKISEMFAGGKNDLSISTCETRGPLWNVVGIPLGKALFYWEDYRPRTDMPPSEVNEAKRLRKSEYYHQGGIGSNDGIVNYYEFLFDTDGRVLFCYLKQGTGNLSRISRCKWGREERYYFHGSAMVRAIMGGKTYDDPGGDIAKRGPAILERGRSLKTMAETIYAAPLEVGAD